MVHIRPAIEADYPHIERLINLAFGTPFEAALVAELKANGKIRLSLVAEAEGVITGHILFSDMRLAAGNPQLKVAGLAPMAVLPSHQKQGIGRALIQAGLGYLSGLGYAACAVLGHPHYYPKFGFEPAAKFGLSSEFPGAGDAFMIHFLQPETARKLRGKLCYQAEFQTTPDP